MNDDAEAGSASTRDRIPVVALRLFAEKGYEATSMREIAEQLNMTKAALYYHFDSKEDIVRAVVSTMHDKISELVTWAATQKVDDDLRREVLSRWSDIRQSQGLALFRFMVTNRQVLDDARPDHQSMKRQMSVLYDILTPADASVEEKVRVRMALMAITMAGMTGDQINADADEIFAAARRVSFELLPTRD